MDWRPGQTVPRAAVRLGCCRCSCRTPRIPRVTIGGEFQFGRRTNFSDGFNANDYRMQFSIFSIE
ncbi:MAG: hypothetical protein DME98_02975 [Verrucomicrobia bacterium]|nr:MAG: hypothetical protein DME98_02975 [Verrucomicrobiota bacterium]PYT45150.1 MAG: hypothetical protein DMG45_02405 [Acidobacteriota bacterium]